MICLSFPFILLLSICCSIIAQQLPADPEIKLNVSEVITFYGYPCELHQVSTVDGYILSMQRIPAGINGNIVSQKPVVFLQHGLLDSSFTWVNNRPDKSLAFILADNGFDVWLGNVRGNIYSRRHTTYSTSSNVFWDFTWDEMVQYDLDAMINYVLTVSGAQKLGYIGHSQGTEIAFAKFSLNSDLNSKISSFVALAPIAYLGHVKTALKYLAPLSGGLNALINTFGDGEFLPNNDLLATIGKLVCGDKLTSIVCGNALSLMAGPEISNLNYSRIPVILSNYPAGTSSKNMNHYGQSVLSNKFQMYDNGWLENFAKYGQLNPPEFSLNTFGIPVAVFWGGNDWLAVPEDVQRVITELGSNVKLNKFIPSYNHLDFIWGISAHTVLYPDVINFLNTYN